LNPPSLPFGVFVRQVPVNSPDQYAAVLVANPSGNSHIVDARHDAHADKIVPTIVESEIGRPTFLSHQQSHSLIRRFRHWRLSTQLDLGRLSDGSGIFQW
jgi:hypothetical protein